MKLLIDENLSPHLARMLADVYPGSMHLEDCGLSSSSDDEIWNFALENQFAIVTKDSDFSSRIVLAESAPKIIWLRIGNCTTMRAGMILRNYSERIYEFLNSGKGRCMEIKVPM
jgi:predicted nuclease of predicted toxin-antitoxin system